MCSFVTTFLYRIIRCTTCTNSYFSACSLVRDHFANAHTWKSWNTCLCIVLYLLFCFFHSHICHIDILCYFTWSCVNQFSFSREGLSIKRKHRTALNERYSLGFEAWTHSFLPWRIKGANAEDKCVLHRIHIAYISCLHKICSTCAQWNILQHLLHLVNW